MRIRPDRDRPPRIGGGFRIGRRGPGCGCFSCLPLAAALGGAAVTALARRAGGRPSAPS
ncbi:hypothetical protein [Streptomyces sp.]